MSESCQKIKCELCPYEASFKSNLREHVKRVHDKIRDHICEDCGSWFFSGKDLRIHVKGVHLKIKDHICEDCGSSFSLIGALRQHRKCVHLKIKDHICQKCGVGFSTKLSLIRHEKLHSEISNVVKEEEKSPYRDNVAEVECSLNNEEAIQFEGNVIENVECTKEDYVSESDKLETEDVNLSGNIILKGENDGLESCETTEKVDLALPPLEKA